MEVAGAMTYGNFFDLPGRDVYTVRLEVSGESHRRHRGHSSSPTITATIDRAFAARYNALTGHGGTRAVS
jgi:hypothetical protein